MSLRSINFNLLPILLALLREQNVSRAAERVSLTQSGVSTALARLRVAFNDPLLVPNGRRMELTHRGRELLAPVEELCVLLQSLTTQPKFDAAVLKRAFVIGTADFVAFHVASFMLPKLAAVAPGVDLEFSAEEPPFTRLLARGELDFAIMPWMQFQNLDRTNLLSAPLYRDDYVAVVGPGHPLYKVTAPTAADFKDARYLLCRLPPGWDEERRHALSGEPKGARGVLKVQHLSLLPLLAYQTDTIAIAPRGFAKLIAQALPLRLLAVPGDMVEIELHLVWNIICDRDPAHIWFRRLLIDSVTEDAALDRPFPAGKSVPARRRSRSKRIHRKSP